MKKTAKRLLALGMTLSIAVGMFPVTAMAANGMPDSYDFRNATEVKTSWEVVREDTTEKYNWSVSANGLTLKTHNGDVHSGTNNAKNIFVQKNAATGNWVAETKITLDDGFSGHYQQGAILAYENDGYYVKFSYEYNPGKAGGDNTMILQLSSETNNQTPADKFSIDLQEYAVGTVVYLQLTKSGNTYSAAYSTNGVDFDPACESVTNEMTAPKLALAAFNGGITATEENPEITKAVTFAYVAAMTAEHAEAVEDLEEAIAALPETVSAVTTDDFTAIDAAKAQYDDLSDLALRDTLITKSAHLNDLVAKVAAMRADIKAAADVDALIADIGTITLDSKAAIKAARDAYTALFADQKALVTKLAMLTAAEAAYDALAAKAVDDLIDAIGTVTLDSKTKIATARTAYDALTDAQKSLVNSDKKGALESAEKVYHAMDLINQIGTPITMSSKAKIDAARAAYNALPNDTEKGKVTNYTTLTTAKTVYGVVEKIHAIGIVYATDASKNEIKAARDAYNALTSNDLKAMVGNYATLQNAEKAQAVVDKIAAIGTVAATSACKTKIAEARSAFDALTSTQEAMVGNETTLLTAEADYVKALINDIGTVTLDSKAKIEAARTAYKNLTSGQKTAVGSTIYAKLTAAEAALADLTAADAVDTKIDAIGTVAATAACKTKIDAARTAYDALTTAQKALVKDYDDLQDAERLYALLAALEGPCDGGVNCPAHPFTDVNSSLWYHEAVDYVLTEELFKGVSATQFSPNGTMTRAMIWTVLARMDDANLAVTTPWYKSAQNWAVNNQVSDGTTPDGSVTREQLVTMLWRFMDEPQANGSLAGYPDAGKVSSWAKEAMTWAVANGVVQGVGNANGTVTLNPGATATRAQVAQMFMNFLTK